MSGLRTQWLLLRGSLSNFRLLGEGIAGCLVDMRTDVLRGIASVGVLLLIGAIAIVIAVPPASQYEISIYGAYPNYFWGLVVGAMFAGSIVIIGSAVTSGDRSWVFGVALLLMTNALLFLLPYFRGYQMYGRGDPLSHIGFVEDIVISADLGSNIYPPMHLLILGLSEATGVDSMTVSMVIPVTFSLLYFGGMFYLLRSLFDSRVYFLFGLAFVLLPVLGRTYVGLRPFDVSVLLVPFVFYLFIRSQRAPVPRVRAAFVISLIAILLYHPLTALFLIAVFTLWLLGKYAPAVEIEYATPTNLVSLSFVVFLAWYSSFTGIILRFESVFQTLTGQSRDGAPVDVYRDTSEQATIALLDLLRIVTFSYGIELILFALGFLFLGFALLLIHRGDYAPTQYVIMFGGTLALFSVGGIFFLLADLQVPHGRPFQLAMIGAVLVIGQLFYLLGNRVHLTRTRPKLRSGVYVSMAGVILVLVLLSVFSLYPSPFGFSSNSQVTEMEVDGSQWVTEHGEAGSHLIEVDLNYHRHHHAGYGTSTDLPFTWTSAPPHFNYTEYDYLGSSFENDTYLSITEKGRIVYPEVFTDYPENWRYTPEDFEQLERDTTTERIYDNGGYNQYIIDGIREPETEIESEMDPDTDSETETVTSTEITIDVAG